MEEEPFVMLTEDAAEKVKSNRHLMVPYSFAQDRRQDIAAENCELTVQYAEEDCGSYTFEMELQSWEGKTLAKAIGSMILEKQEDEWKIVSLILDGIISEDMAIQIIIVQVHGNTSWLSQLQNLPILSLTYEVCSCKQVNFL